jgi:hypothetical protein
MQQAGGRGVVTDLDQAIDEAVRSTSSYREAAYALNLAGHKTRRGTPWTSDTLQKRLHRRGRRSGAVSKPMGEQTLKRLAELGKEGLPATWIAEDLHPFSANAVRRRLRRLEVRSNFSAEWNPVWKQIAASERLLELHREFAPKNGRRVL